MELAEKARTKSSELMTHLETRAQDTKKSKEHYLVIMQNMTGVNSRIASLDASMSSADLDNELENIEKDIVPLTIQSPYTLLMMRVVEIGLPLLLSIFSVFFVLRYSLTEKRSHEIKEHIRQRNEEKANATESAI